MIESGDLDVEVKKTKYNGMDKKKGSRRKTRIQTELDNL